MNEPAPISLDYATVADLTSDYRIGLEVWPIKPDPDWPAGTVSYCWVQPGGPSAINVTIEPTATSPDMFAQIRAGQIYTGNYPPYEIIDTDRLRAADAVGALIVDQDSGDTDAEIGSIRQVTIHTPQFKIIVVAWKAAQIIEIGTRVAEKLNCPDPVGDASCTSLS
ncbi:hypothetical protein VMT65_38050 [Nocardia sp. CDC153]|uniref:hypothetical protein n=1 Tax=Nocardia sp. CDC153 TaxID=3112167 RepID=UPI002DB75A7E|nr:hypothetical protein [Nocardia sp. CDC153]MEC3958889.1 hypothetical protein [Nocardia sp. CDC153]